MNLISRVLAVSVLLPAVPLLAAQSPAAANALQPGTRTLMDAHNCYPYYTWWSDRIDRALSAQLPLAIEQDLALRPASATSAAVPVVTHTAGEFTGEEPTLEHYFFDRITPIMQAALRDNDRKSWPLITLNLDFKENSPELLRAVLAVLQTHREWLTTAHKIAGSTKPSPLAAGPLLVLTGEDDRQQKIFYDDLPDGADILLFGAVHDRSAEPHGLPPLSPPDVLETEPASSYRRWWNNPWNVVEAGGQRDAGEWTAADNARLHALVAHAHAQGLWIRFYTLDGAPASAFSSNGWFAEYNFGSLAAARERWDAAIVEGVDYLATDQYEDVGLLTSGAAAEHRRLERRP